MAGTEACYVGSGYEIVRLLLRIQKQQPRSLFALIGEELAHPDIRTRLSAIHRYSSLSRRAGTSPWMARYTSTIPAYGD